MKGTNLSTFSKISEIVSAIAVVISLVYVGSQVRQNTISTQAAMRQSVADNDITYLMTSLDSEILARASFKIENNIAVSGLEMSQLESRQHVNFRVFENAFYQFEQGLLESETWDRYKFIIKDLLESNLAAKRMWASYNRSFTESFQKEVEQLISNSALINETIIRSEHDSLN